MPAFLAIISFAVATFPTPDPPFTDRENPLAFTDSEVAIVFIFPRIGVCLLSTIAAGIDLLVRSRRAQGDEREQYKWLAFAVALLIASWPFALFADYSGIGDAVFDAVAMVALIGLPVSVGIAVLRYRLYDIDIIINRTLVYVPLTAILAGLFVASTTLVRTVFTDLTDAGSDASIAISTLAVVALLTPLKNQLQALVDRHFKEQPDPLANVRKLSTQAKSVMQIIDTERFVETVLTELIAGLNAYAARVELEDRAEPWSLRVGIPGDVPVITTLLLFHGRTVGTLFLWPRMAATRSQSQALEALAGVADALAEVISLGRMTESPGPVVGASEAVRR